MIWPIIFFSKIVNALAKNSKWVALITAFLIWVNDLIDKTVTFVMSQLLDLIASIDVSSLQNVSLSGLEYIGYANAIFPISEAVTLSTTYVTAWLIVIIIRWVKSFVPTLAN